MDSLRVLKIIDGTSVDGPGLRTSIYFAGCDHACPGCHNPQSWDKSGGEPMSIDRIMDHITDNNLPVTFSGGDPLQQNLQALTNLARRIKDAGFDLWCYTGYTFEQLYSDPERNTLLSFFDVLVDGPFDIARRDISLIFKGSANQRLIDVKKSSPGDIHLWESDF